MILVTGANGVIGVPLCQALSDANIPFKTVSRGTNSSIQWDMQQSPDQKAIEQMRTIDSLIHCAPLWFLPAHTGQLTDLGVTRVIGFSSTSVISKQNSMDPHEGRLVELLNDAEQKLMKYSRVGGVDLTILRPSMIYGYRRDQNIMQIANFIQRFGFMILAGEARGLRQPVHALDLASTAIQILRNSTTYGKSYNVAGAEAFTYRVMVERIFAGLGKPPRIIKLPLWLFRVALRGLALVSKFSYNPEMATRMSQDLVYDYGDATTDFGFQPQRFLSKPARDLPIQSG